MNTSSQSPLNKQRNTYLRIIQKALIETIFQNHAQDRIDLLEGLIQENTRLLSIQRPGEITPTFMYNGLFYRSLNWFASREDNRTIHPDMMDKISDFMRDSDFNFAVQKSQVESYVANVLTFSNSLTDLLELIPSKFHTILVNIDENLFNIGPPASVADIEQFKKTHRKGLVEFQRLFLERLLIG